MCPGFLTSIYCINIASDPWKRSCAGQPSPQHPPVDQQQHTHPAALQAAFQSRWQAAVDAQQQQAAQQQQHHQPQQPQQPHHPQPMELDDSTLAAAVPPGGFLALLMSQEPEPLQPQPQPQRPEQPQQPQQPQVPPQPQQRAAGLADTFVRSLIGWPFRSLPPLSPPRRVSPPSHSRLGTTASPLQRTIPAWHPQSPFATLRSQRATRHVPSPRPHVPPTAAAAAAMDLSAAYDSAFAAELQRRMRADAQQQQQQQLLFQQQQALQQQLLSSLPSTGQGLSGAVPAAPLPNPWLFGESLYACLLPFLAHLPQRQPPCTAHAPADSSCT